MVNHSRAIAAIGMFDGVHSGHRHLLMKLQEAAQARGLVTMAVTFPGHPRLLTSASEAPQLLTTPAEKEALLASAGVERTVMLDFTPELCGMSARQFMRMLHRHYGVEAIMLGFNNRFGHDCVSSPSGYVAMGREEGVEVIVCDELEEAGVSSSAIRKLLAGGDVEGAAAMLGRHYSLAGTVVHGKELGRTIGYPTANILPISCAKAVPAAGVYAAAVTLPGGRRLPGMLNIGHRPTVDAPGAPESIEVHIIGYEGNLYGCEVEVEFLGRLRDERRFPTLEALKEALGRDALASQEIFIRSQRLSLGKPGVV